MKNNLSIFNNLRPLTVGFDDMFAHFEHMMDDRFITNGTVSNFPPYNIVKTGKNTYNIELALAGFNKKDIEVEYKENMLTVKSKKQEETKADEEGDARVGLSYLLRRIHHDVHEREVDHDSGRE